MTPLYSERSLSCVRDFCKNKLHYVEIEGIDNKTYGDFYYELPRINFDHKFTTRPEIQIEVADYKKESWLYNNNIDYTVWENKTNNKIAIISHKRLQAIATTLFKEFKDTAHRQDSSLLAFAEDSLKNICPLYVPPEIKNQPHYGLTEFTKLYELGCGFNKTNNCIEGQDIIINIDSLFYDDGIFQYLRRPDSRFGELVLYES